MSIASLERYLEFKQKKWQYLQQFIITDFLIEEQRQMRADLLCACINDSVCVWSHFSRVWLWDPIDCSPPGSSVQGILHAKYWSGFPCPAPGDLLNSGAEPASLESPTWQVGSLLLMTSGEPILTTDVCFIVCQPFSISEDKRISTAYEILTKQNLVSWGSTQRRWGRG